MDENSAFFLSHEFNPYINSTSVNGEEEWYKLEGIVISS